MDLTSALVPDIADYPYWSQVGDPVWSITEQSSGASMTIDSATGVITTNGAASGSYVNVRVTYEVKNEQTGAVSSVYTDAQIKITGSDATTIRAYLICSEVRSICCRLPAVSPPC